MYLSLCVPHCMCVLSLFQGWIANWLEEKKGRKITRAQRTRDPPAWCSGADGSGTTARSVRAYSTPPPPPPRRYMLPQLGMFKSPPRYQQSKLNKLVQSQQKKACNGFIFRSNDALLSVLNRSSVRGGGEPAVTTAHARNQNHRPPHPPTPHPSVLAFLPDWKFAWFLAQNPVDGLEVYSRPLHD
jgi:hypothetical protein